MYSINLRILFMYFLMLLSIYPNFSWASKSNTNCGQHGNLDTICSPITGDSWRQNGTYLATWNPFYPTYVSSASLSIYIYFVENYEKINVISFHNVTNTGEYPILINNTWFDPSLNLPSSPKHDALFYLISSELNPITEMNNLNSVWSSPIHFNVEPLSPPLSNPQVVNTTASSLPVSSSSDRPPWVIPLIVIGCLLLLLGCISTFYILRILRRRKLVFDEKAHSEQISSKSSTIYSPSCDQFSKKNQQNDRQHTNMSSVTPPPPTLQSISNLSSRSEPPLTSTDAILIADTFRQRMRRPNWPHCSNIVQEQHSSIMEPTACKDGDEDYNTRKEEDEENKRQLASERLLKNELEAEGTLMKKVGKRAHLLSTIQYDE
ncbi:hypothetical protein BCR42DRAFT_39454 [Absidia repens]|uniref:Uncharacterized protein n=1 Tax=Absidia repens TaxID=90262 RepID=A0A1X2IHH5_9FUNG|nr:hypothetical protein BCR42DRAFT_39454 [Absidia repens]